MPELINDNDFNTKLNEIQRNTMHTAQFLEKGVDDFQLNGYVIPFGYRFVKSRTEHQYRLITISDQPVTAYAIKLEFYDHIVLGFNTCTQVMVWRSIRPEHRRAILDLPAIFFSYLVDHFTIVVSDSQHTELGRRFWETRIIESLPLPSIHVYVSERTEDGRDAIITFSEVKSDHDFYEIWREFCWGKIQDVHSLRLFVISKVKLS